MSDVIKKHGCSTKLALLLRMTRLNLSKLQGMVEEPPVIRLGEYDDHGCDFRKGHRIFMLSRKKTSSVIRFRIDGVLRARAGTA